MADLDIGAGASILSRYLRAEQAERGRRRGERREEELTKRQRIRQEELDKLKILQAGYDPEAYARGEYIRLPGAAKGRRQVPGTIERAALRDLQEEAAAIRQLIADPLTEPEERRQARDALAEVTADIDRYVSKLESAGFELMLPERRELPAEEVPEAVTPRFGGLPGRAGKWIAERTVSPLIRELEKAGILGPSAPAAEPIAEPGVTAPPARLPVAAVPEPAVAKPKTAFVRAMTAAGIDYDALPAETKRQADLAYDNNIPISRIVSELVKKGYGKGK